MAEKKLSQNDREFFNLVSQAVFINPFSEQRAELDRKISGSSRTAPWRDIIPEVIGEVGRRIEKLDADESAKIQNFEPNNRDMIEHVFLFDIYHKFALQFDKLITDPPAGNEDPIEVPFADQALTRISHKP